MNLSTIVRIYRLHFWKISIVSISVENPRLLPCTQNYLHSPQSIYKIKWHTTHSQLS